MGSAEYRGLAAFFDTAAKTLLEPVDTTRRVHHLLLTGVERVTLRTHVELHVAANGGTGLDDITAAAGCGDVYILGMNTFFHEDNLSGHAAT